MMQATEKIIDRIRKLLALANSANENEAAAAAMKAQTLLAEHNLSEADLGTVNDEDMVLDGELITDSRPWRRYLAAELARLYFCDYFYGFVKESRPNHSRGYRRFDRHTFVGRPHNVLITKSIFRYLCDTIDRLAIEAANKYPKGSRVSFVTSFRHACAKRLGERVREKWFESANPLSAQITDANSKLPALYNTEAEKVSAFMKSAVSDLVKHDAFDPKIHSHEGAAAGHRAGGEIGLDVQIENEVGAYMLPAK